MREYALVFAVAAAVTYLLTPLCRRLALVTNTMAEVRDRDVHDTPTPRLGGLAMFAGVLAAMLVARALPSLSDVFRTTADWKGVLLGGALVVVVGAADDRWGLDAFTKLAGQALAAGVMVLYGVQLLFIRLPGVGTLSLDQNVAVPATVLLTLLMINSVNFIDGLDGLAAGVVAIAGIAFFGFCYQLSVVKMVTRATPATLLCAILAGVCVGFLPHNFNPARIFMGDAGSMLLGLLLAAAVTTATGLVDPNNLGFQGTAFFFPVLLPLLILTVPFADLLLAVGRRTRAGRSPFSADKEHLHHRLLEIGHSHRRAVLVIYCWSALLAFGGVVVALTSHPLRVLAGMLVVAGAGASRTVWRRTRPPTS